MKAKMNELEKNFVKGIVTMRNQLFCYNILIGSRKKNISSGTNDG